MKLIKLLAISAAIGLSTAANAEVLGTAIYPNGSWIVLTDLACPTSNTMLFAQFKGSTVRGIKQGCWKAEKGKVVLSAGQSSKEFNPSDFVFSKQRQVARAPSYYDVPIPNDIPQAPAMPAMVIMSGNGPVSCQPSGAGFQCY